MKSVKCDRCGEMDDGLVTMMAPEGKVYYEGYILIGKKTSHITKSVSLCKKCKTKLDKMVTKFMEDR